MSAKFEIHYGTIAALEKKMALLPKKMEGVINETLHTRGIQFATEEITKLIPMSSWRKGIHKSIHAKTSKWSKSESHNLGFTIKARGGAANKRGSFGYLVFPNEGRGSSNPLEQRFMERGIKHATPKILTQLHEDVDKLLKEEL